MPLARIAIGLVLPLGPIAIFLFVSAFPGLFSSNTILMWHYLSAFGLVLTGPIGFILIVTGVIELIKSPQRNAHDNQPSQP